MRKDSHGKTLHRGEYERPGGTYQYKYMDGKMRRTLSAPTLRELRDKEDAAELDRLNRIRPTRDTLDDYFDVWQETKRGLKPNVRAGYVYAYTHHIQGTELGRMCVRDIKRTDIKRTYNAMRDKGISVYTIDSVQTIVHQILDICLYDEVIRYNPADGALRELKREARQQAAADSSPGTHDALTLDEQDELIKAAGQPWRDIIIIMIDTGMRVGELTALQVSDLDTEGRSVHVGKDISDYSKGGHVVTVVQTPKSAAGKRDIPLTRRAAESFARVLERRKGRECKTEIAGYKDFLFLNRFNNALREKSINRALHRIVARTSVHGIASHALRHTCCTNLCRAGVDLKTIMDIMGHDDIQTTMDIYAACTRDMRETARDGLERYLGWSETDSETE